ncbi:diguanylate cyclase domain-containing protein [Gracilibacillus xinjiangensis]|uniref:Diguanylate cyclase domain-containing protein n=1 Tax=Gracilibacillus xinjiangensis TaxID=1193282 RepID=A0ABV8WUF0_9BACI
MVISKERQKFTVFMILLGLLIVLEFFPLTIIFGVAINFAPFLYLAMIKLFGFRASLVATIVMTAVSLALSNEDAFSFLSIIEVLIIGGLYKIKGRDLFTWSFVYSFLMIFIAIIVNSFYIPTEVVGQLVLLNVSLVVISTIYASLVADMFCDYYCYLPAAGRFFAKKKPLYFGQIISNLLIFAAISPILFVIFFHANTLAAELYEQWEQETIELEEFLQSKTNRMESIEIKNYALDSKKEMARLKYELDQFLTNENGSIYVLNENLNVWIEAGLQKNTRDIEEKLNSGNVLEIGDNDYIWFPEENLSLIDWANASYIGKTKFLDKLVYMVIPVDAELIIVIKKLKVYLLISLLVLFISLLFGLITNNILSKALGTITNITSDIPNKVSRKQTIDWNNTNIVEFSNLIDNVKIVAEKLQSMFRKTEIQNQLLLERTNKLMESEAELYHLAHYDVLTNLPNRHSYYTDMEQKLNKASGTGTRFAVIFLDLDNFKQINDTLGHSGGDKLLRIFANRLGEFEKEAPYIKVYRLAGDEFVFIVDLASRDEIKEIVEELHEKIHQPIKLFDKTVELSASIGISVFPEDGRNVDALLHRADTLMYDEKHIHHQNEGSKLYWGDKE